MGKKEEKAIIAFESQKRTIDKLDINGTTVWKNHVSDLISKYIGLESELKNTLGDYGVFAYPEYHNRDKIRASNLIESCIEYVKNNGVRSDHKGNFLSKMGDEAAVGLLLGIITLAGGGGYFCGDFFANHKIDLERIEMKYKIDSLQKLFSIPLPPSAKLDSSQSNKIGVDKKADNTK